MIIEYIEEAMARARYEIIEDEEPYYGEVPPLKGVWATGRTLEACRKNLREVLDNWIVLRLKKGLPIPARILRQAKITRKEWQALHGGKP